jgi:glycosyltransferase involved in cell wall biosynthesis
MPDSRPTVVLLVGSLAVGGAEKQMLALAGGLSGPIRVVLAHLKDDDALLAQVGPSATPDVVGLGAGPGLDLAALRRLRALLRRTRADVVVAANLYALFYARAASVGLPGRPRVVEVLHTTAPYGLKAKLEVLRYLPLVWTATRIVFLCDAQRRYWRRRGMWARRRSVIHNGVDVEHFTPTPSERSRGDRTGHGFTDDDLVVGVCAVLRPEKGHRHLLDAIADLDRSGGPRWCAVFIGDGPERRAIERHVERLGLNGRVVLTGMVADVRPVLAACDLVAVASATETFSIAALEAMAVGRPLLMSDVGGAREQVVPGRTGWLYEAGDRDALARCLAEASDRTLLRAMGAAARERVVELFALPRMLERYSEVVLADSRRR